MHTLYVKLCTYDWVHLSCIFISKICVGLSMGFHKHPLENLVHLLLLTLQYNISKILLHTELKCLFRLMVSHISVTATSFLLVIPTHIHLEYRYELKRYFL